MACNTRLIDRAQFNEAFGVLDRVDVDFRMPKAFEPDLKVFGPLDYYLKELIQEVELYRVVRPSDARDDVMAIAYPKETLWANHVYPVAAERGWMYLRDIRLKMGRVTVVKYLSDCEDRVFRCHQLPDAVARAVYTPSYWGTCMNTRYISQAIYDYRMQFREAFALSKWLSIADYQRQRRGKNKRRPDLNTLVPHNVPWVHLEIYLSSHRNRVVFLASVVDTVQHSLWSLLDYPLFDPFKKTYFKTF